MSDKQYGNLYGSNTKAVHDVLNYGCKIGLFKNNYNGTFQRISFNEELVNQFIKYRPPTGLSGRKCKNGPSSYYYSAIKIMFLCYNIPIH